jgi:Bacteriophage related domain of unknown function
VSNDHWNDAQRAIESRFFAQWASATPVKVENDKTAIGKGEEYATISLLQGEGRIASLSATPRRRYQGLAVVRVFVPEGTGSKRSNELLALAERAFYDANGAGRQFASGTNGIVTFEGAGDIETEGVQSGYFIKVLRCPFYRDQQGE